MNRIRLIAAHVLLLAAYSVTWLIAAVGRLVPRRAWNPTGRIAVTGTIFNPNWYLSHITPLIRSGVREVLLVIDEPQAPLDGVRFACPPKWLARLTSRAVAKAIWMLGVGLRYKPDLFMGYNLVAGGCTALAAGAILGRPTCYQMTGGHQVLSTPGDEICDYETVHGFRQVISRIIERFAISVVRRFDLIVVRGSRSKAFLAGYGIEKNVVVITGSVHARQLPSPDREIDLIFVGRLHPIKQVNQFIQIISEVSRVVPAVRATIVGDGPLMADMQAYAGRLGIDANVEFPGKRADVGEFLARSKVFVLTSKSEGLSIAMAEAMIAGVVPVVANVGELGDLVQDGVNGYLIEPNNVGEYVARIVSLLRDRRLWSELSANAAEACRGYAHIDVVGENWRRCLQPLVKGCWHSGAGMDGCSASLSVSASPKRISSTRRRDW